MYTISFTEAERALHAADAAVAIAEGHGCLCGALCALPQFSSQSWLQELLPDPAGQPPSPGALVDAVLERLHSETQTALRGDDMQFAPLLPDDAAPLAERIAALAQWSQGFLYGFGIGVPSAARRQFPGDVGEVLKDLGEIARADAAAAGDSDVDEQAYTELVEYLRAAVQLVHDELAGQRSLQVRRTRSH